ncbi:MAG: endonuclease III, partial [Caulobacter sp.]|nr:endonuclease III [Caulobacter sp.]
MRPILPAMKKPAARKRLSPKEKVRVGELFDRFATLSDDPRTELAFQDPFTLVVAVALSAQATDVQVNKATAKLFPVASTPQAMLALGEVGLIPYVNSIGLFRNKAKNVIALSRIVLEKHGGKTPLNRADLEALPGV